MHPQAACATLKGLLLLACVAGCALPKVALGASVTLGRSAGQDGAAHTRVRSALWLALIYAPGAGEPEREPHELDGEVELADAGPPSDVPCAFELACELERKALEEQERELSP